MNKVNPFKNLKLDKEEQKIEKDLADGKFIGVSDLDRSKRLFKEAAKNYRELQKSKRITIRVNQEDLLKVKARAKRNKMPYQTLLNVLIHQYADGYARIQL